MNDVVSPKKPFWRSKAVIFATIFSLLFLGLFYLAVSNEPDYMPSQKNKQHSMQNMDHSSNTQSDMKMTDEEMKNMSPEDMKNMHHDSGNAH